MTRLAIGALAIGATLLAGCSKTEVSESDIDALGKEHSQGSYEDAMKKAGRGAELEEQKKLSSDRGQDPGR